MTITTGDDLNRTTSGRFVRNLALSLSGGALLTLLGASAAHADDLADAGTASDGSGQAHSGDATAIGNKSGTNSTQTVTVSGNLGTIQVINQQANVSNVGAGISNTGGNIAIGNGSVNDATGTQTGANGLGPATNTGTAGNTSNGSAAISTGNASSIGNQSSTTINQTANGSAHGLLGGILIINQDANVLNSGVALANTGGNEATGNESDNTAGLVQDANTAAGIAANSGKATNNSDGKATINTGNASATGNKSETNIVQSATGSAGGALGGLVIIDQNAFVANVGVATANTGDNFATGNDAFNGDDPGEGAFLDQSIGNDVDPDVIGVASNNGEASNWSDGSAGITTGDATAIGNDSKTSIKQFADSDIEGPGGGAIVTQGSSVLNIGLAAANSGNNDATGNQSDNFAEVDQTAPSSGGLDVGVAGNFGLASNSSDGNGTVHSGKAWANGNQSQTDVTQAATAEGGAFNLLPQFNSVQNIGLSAANSGFNSATGNQSESDSDVDQNAELPDDQIGIGVIGNFGMASNSSDGSATITTGDAVATGNRSTTNVGQGIDPTGLIIPVQIANVTNLGVAAANSGGNTAVGNESFNEASISDQSAEIGEDNDAGDVTIAAGTLVASNNGEASNSSDGTASIRTGNAAATGNDSITSIGQTSTGSIDGAGLILNTQTALVANTGVGLANSGFNTATGNTSFNSADIEDQTAEIASDNDDADSVSVLGLVMTAANNGTASNASDGSASVATGNASGTGNRSTTNVRQDETGEVSGLGGILNTQVAVVGNVGVGIGNSGVNGAVGNDSSNEADLNQQAKIASDNEWDQGEGDVDIFGTFLTANNNGTASNTSDGTANISTGSAMGVGNSSATDVSQATGGDVDGLGLVLNTQVAGVANVGLGVANSGLNVAVGNFSQNSDSEFEGPGAELFQEALIGSENDLADGQDVELDVFGPITASNSGEASNTSDGSADITTGGAQGQGNVSATQVVQDPDSSVDGAGLVIGTQVAGVLNAGVGVANSGLNAAFGNASGTIRGENHAGGGQEAKVGSSNTDDDVEATVLGAVTASNQGTASNTSDGHAKVKTGGALATGNASATNVRQAQSGTVSTMGVVIGTQVGGVANVGVGVANSGLNLAIGNASANDAHLGDDDAQSSLILSEEADPTEITVLGPVTASNSGEASNTSDGEACVCTGDAVASGNVSSTTLVQDLNLSTDTGLVLVTEAGGVLNAGLGLANSGLNLGIGNISDNTALIDQAATINDALPDGGIVGPQTAPNNGTAKNGSNGKGLVASGNASGTGNQSTTNFAQAADVDSALAINSITGGTTNAGLGLANAGLNVGVGNASTNFSDLDQSADGSGLVGNTGEATNESDGTAIIGDPSKCDDVTTTPEKPGTTGLPRTGGPLETEAAIALMLLLVGFGLRRKGQSLA